ncbi:MAG: DUF3450 domain-containing protein [Pseudohongiellaceae bacterium]
MRHPRNSLIKIFAVAVLASTAWTAVAQDDIVQEFSEANQSLRLLMLNNEHLTDQIERQEALLASMEEQIEAAALLASEEESPLIPLMEDMISSLESFVETDFPFEIEDRREEINNARNLVDNEEASIQQKFNRLLDVIRAEAEYAATLDAYQDEVIDFNGSELEVNIVRVGRISLAFQSVDRTVTGYWDKNARQWVEGDPGAYRTAIDRAYRVANSELAAEMLNLPIHAPEAVQ